MHALFTGTAGIPAAQQPHIPPPFPACSDALESHVAAVVGAEVSRTLAKCGLAEVVARLQAVQVRVQGASVPLP